MAHLTRHERLTGRLSAAQARLRLLLDADGGQITAANRAKVDRLTTIIEQCRAELATDAPDPSRARRDIDE